MYKKQQLTPRSFPCQHQPQLSVRNQQDQSSHGSHHAITSLVFTTSCLGKAPAYWSSCSPNDRQLPRRLCVKSPLCIPSSHLAHSMYLQGPPSLCRPYERTCWHHTQPHAAPLRSKGLHHYAGRIRAFAGVTHSHTQHPCVAELTLHLHLVAHSELSGCRDPDEGHGALWLVFNHLAPPASSTYLEYMCGPPPLKVAARIPTGTKVAAFSTSPEDIDKGLKYCFRLPVFSTPIHFRKRAGHALPLLRLVFHSADSETYTETRQKLCFRFGRYVALNRRASDHGKSTKAGKPRAIQKQRGDNPQPGSVKGFKVG